MTSKAIAQELGSRIEQMRLEQNMTQQQLADEIGLSRVSYRKLVMGSGKFENVIAVLQALGKVELLQNFITETTFSPMQQLKMQGKQRQRATAVSTKVDDEKSENKLDW